MPSVVVQDDTAAASIPPPTMPSAPPTPPQFPGFPIQTDFHLPNQPTPALTLADPEGTLIRFQQGSDQLASQQDGPIGDIIGRRKGGTIYIHGYGEAQSLSGSDQSHGIVLGLARAQTVATLLQERGVPATAIRIRAVSLGDGARLSLQQ